MVFGRTDVVEPRARVLVLCYLSAGICVILVREFGQTRTTRTDCLKNSYIIPSVPQEVEPWNMAGTISCADPTARFPCTVSSKYFSDVLLSMAKFRAACVSILFGFNTTF